MQKLNSSFISVKPLAIKPLMDPVPAPAPASGDQDILGQFKANLAQVGQLQQRLNFMVREVSGLVKPKL